MANPGEQAFKVTITGKVAENISPEDAAAALSAKFGISADTAGGMLNGQPKVIKKDIDSQTAEKFSTALNQIGVLNQIEAVETHETAVIEPPSTPAPAAAEKEPSVFKSAPDHPGYAFSIEGRPDYSFLTVTIPAGETLKVEASAMATMDVNLRMKTKMRGGLGRLVTGESIFINEFTAEGGPGEIGIAPGPPGDLLHRHLSDETIYLQNSAFVAATMGVAVETKWQGLTKGFFSGENLFLIRCKGTGDLWFNTYGAMIEIDVTGDYVVDTGHIVAFTEGLEYRISSVGGYKSFFFSGEGFVCRFSGNGKVWLQTRMAGAFVSWAHLFRPVRKKG